MEKHTTKITSNSILQSGLPNDYKRAIAEYIWNGFDAKATEVNILYSANEIGTLEYLKIIDNGIGIKLDSIENTFGCFLDSEKKSTYESGEFVKGKKGKGRFAFCFFANSCIWHTKTKTDDNHFLEYDIFITDDSLKEYGIDHKNVLSNAETGTSVNFFNIHSLTGDLLDTPDFKDFLCSEFGWFLFLNKEKNIQLKINNISLDYRGIIEDFDEIEYTLNNFTFEISFIRWSRKIGDKYFFYFLDEDRKEQARKHTSLNNKAIDFHHSIYIESTYFDNFQYTPDDAPVLGFEKKNQNDSTFKKLLKVLSKYLFEKEKQFLKEQKADILLKRYNENNILPDFKNNIYEQSRKKDLETVIKEIYCIQPKIFEKLSNNQSKTIVGFLNLLLDTDQRENVLTILEGIVQLTEEERESLSNSLKRTNFSNITKLIKLLENRFKVVEILKILVFELEKFTTERNHIQKIIEENYWLFGEQYHLVSADKNMEIVLNNYFKFIEDSNSNILPKSVDSQNKLKRPDIFICRQSEYLDIENTEYSIEENIVVELKRPSVIIGKKQYNQIEDYMLAIIDNPAFNSQIRKWKFIIVGKSVDSYIAAKYESCKDKGKKFLIGGLRNFELYAMTWDDLFKSFEIKHKHLINKLEFRETLLEELQNRGVNLNDKIVNELTNKAI